MVYYECIEAEGWSSRSEMKSGRLTAGAEEVKEVEKAGGWNSAGKVKLGRLRAGAIVLK